MPRRYWMLATSLPYLPPIDRATDLPIGRERLQARLQLLPDPDLGLLRAAYELATGQGTSHADAARPAQGQGVAQVLLPAPLLDLVEGLRDRHTLLAALRRRRAGMPAPHVGDAAWWSAVPGGQHRPGRRQALDSIRRNWAQPDFGLERTLKWLPRARALLDQGDMPGLDRLLMDLLWADCERLRRDEPYTLQALLAYWLQWDALDRWLSRNTILARQHLARLVAQLSRPASQVAAQ